MKLTLKEIKPVAFKLYTEGIAVSEIIARYKLNASTVYKWINKERWDEKRKLKQDITVNTPEFLKGELQKIVNLLTKSREKLEENESLDIEALKDGMRILAQGADSVSKISKAINSTYKSQDRLGSILFAIGEFRLYLLAQKKSFDQDFLDKQDRLWEGFQEECIKKFSPKNLI
jgi:transposase